MAYKIVLGLSYVQLATGRIFREGVRGIRFGVGDLELERLGDHPVLLVLTYPDPWRGYCANDRALNRHIAEFYEEWAERWGPPLGFWVKEFQKRGAPHLNWYVAWPDGAGGYEEARRASVAVAKAKRSGQPRGLVAADGELGWWARTAWAEVVTGNDGSAVARAHHVAGVNIRVSHYTDRAGEMKDVALVASYLAREVGKESQKRAPQGFGRVRPWWAPMGMERGEPVVVEVPYLVFTRMKQRLEKWIVEKGGKAPLYDLPGRGLIAWGMSDEEGARLLGEVEQELRREYGTDEPF